MKDFVVHGHQDVLLVSGSSFSVYLSPEEYMKIGLFWSDFRGIPDRPHIRLRVCVLREEYDLDYPSGDVSEFSSLGSTLDKCTSASLRRSENVHSFST